MQEEYACKECESKFKSEGALHKHLKAHNMSMAEYYTRFYPRYNKLTKEPLPFKNKLDYFNIDFSNRGQMIEWCNNTDNNEVKEYIINQLKNRVKNKELKYAPNHLELEVHNLLLLICIKRISAVMDKLVKSLALNQYIVKESNKVFSGKII